MEDAPQMSPEDVAKIQAAIARAEIQAASEEDRAAAIVAAGGDDPRIEKSVTVLDDEAQVMVDTRILDQIIGQVREGYARAKVEYLLGARGLMMKGAPSSHPEQMKAEVVRHQKMLDVLVQIGREMAADETMEFPSPSPLELAGHLPPKMSPK